jgi:hypothetical protein
MYLPTVAWLTSIPSLSSSPNPEKAVRAEEHCTTRALAPQDGHLMSKGDELNFEGGTATNTEGEQRHEGGKNRDHAHDGMAVTPKSIGFLSASEL